MTCAPSIDSDQPGHLPGLIRVFAVRMKKHWVLSYPLSTHWRFWLDRVDAQADLCLRWVPWSFCLFCHVVAQMLSLQQYVWAWLDCTVIAGIFKTLVMVALKFPILYQAQIDNNCIITLSVWAVTRVYYYMQYSSFTCTYILTFEPLQPKQNGVCPVWSESSLCAQWAAISCGQRRLWSDWADAQADLNLRWVHSPFDGFVMMWLICLASPNADSPIKYFKRPSHLN